MVFTQEREEIEEIELYNYRETILFKEKLEILKQQLPSILDDFKKYYVFYNKNPEFNEYQQMYENIKDNLTKINAGLFTLSNDIETNTDDLNKKLIALDILIRRAKERNRELKRRLGILEHKNSASTEMNSNFQEIYDKGYLQNWGLLLSIIVSIFTIKTIFNKPVV
jgi:CCR4-NOT transcriptional regulation complex NOT5 subunit